MAGVSIKRPAASRKAVFSGWNDLSHTIAYPFEAAIDAMNALDADGRDASALAVVRDYAREILKPVAAALGIPAGDPLLVENVAFRLAADKMLWSEPAPSPGPPARSPDDHQKLVDDITRFVDVMNAKNSNLSDTACLRHPSFKTKFKLGAGMGRKYLAEGRGQKIGHLKGIASF